MLERSLHRRKHRVLDVSCRVRLSSFMNKVLCVFYTVKCYFLPQKVPKCVRRPVSAQTRKKRWKVEPTLRNTACATGPE